MGVGGLRNVIWKLSWYIERSGLSKDWKHIRYGLSFFVFGDINYLWGWGGTE